MCKYCVSKKIIAYKTVKVGQSVIVGSLVSLSGFKDRRQTEVEVHKLLLNNFMSYVTRHELVV